jgi:hypothetical protein
MSTVSGSSLVYLRNAGQRGPLQAYGVPSGARRFSLPPGMISANGARYFALAAPQGPAMMVAYNARTGHALNTWPEGTGWSLAGVSANGQRIVLLRWTRAHGTQFRIADGRTGRVLDRLSLRGSYDVDAISNDGRRLFLIQYVRAGYLVRMYDVGRRALAARILTEKGIPMQGVAWNAVADPRGRWLLTLYIRPDGSAAVHTLDLARGTATCIDLPSGDASWQLQEYALALAVNGRTLYAANPALGVVARVDLNARRVVHVTHFDVDATAAGASSPSAAISHDGRTIYFTAQRTLYAFDARYGRVRGGYDTGGIVGGLAFSGDDRRLLVLRPSGRAIVLAAPTGRRL